MAAFKVLNPFEISADHEPKHLTPGAVYLPGHDITGLMAAEAGELLLFAPEGTFEPIDSEAKTVFDWAARKRAAANEGESPDLQEQGEDPSVKSIKVGGVVKATGSTRTTKGGA